MTPVAQARTGAGGAGAASVAPAQAARRVGVFDVLPPTADLVLSLDVAATRRSRLFLELSPSLAESFDAELAAWEKRCRISPLEVVEWVVLAMVADRPGDMVMIVRGLHRNDLLRCVEEMARAASEAPPSPGSTDAKKPADPSEATRSAEAPEPTPAPPPASSGPTEIAYDGELVRITSGGDTWHLGWLDDVTVAISKLDRAAMAERMRGDNGLGRNQSFMALVSRVTAGAGTWLVYSPGQDGASLMPRMRSILATLGTATGLTLDGALIMDTAAAATDTASSIQMVVQSQNQSPFSILFNKLQVTTSDAEVHFRLELDEDEVTEFVRTTVSSAAVQALFGL